MVLSWLPFVWSPQGEQLAVSARVSDDIDNMSDQLIIVCVENGDIVGLFTILGQQVILDEIANRADVGSVFIHIDDARWDDLIAAQNLPE